MAFTTLYSTNNRLFPPQLLTSSFGILNLTSHIVAIAGPIIAEMQEPFPMLIFGILAAVAGFSSFFIKEVKHEEESNLPNGPI